LQGTCTYDQCLTDDDCPSGDACGCADQFYGTMRQYFGQNFCVHTACHIDADCGPGGYCSPAIDMYCGSITGYRCLKPEDTCGSSADCGDPTGAQCRCEYVTELDHWQCLPRPPGSCGG
jgi:hypothetical protein